MTDQSITNWTAADAAMVEDAVRRGASRRDLLRLLMAGGVAAASGGVILGRNATFVLQDHPRALHVRLIAPVDVRITRAAELYVIPPDVARARQEREDRVRAEMSARLFDWNPNDDSSYDVILNTTHYTTDEAVEMILNAYRIRYGA